MGTLIRFPQERRTQSAEDYRPEPAKVLILPVIKVHRFDPFTAACDAMAESFFALNEILMGPLPRV